MINFILNFVYYSKRKVNGITLSLESYPSQLSRWGHLIIERIGSHNPVPESSAASFKHFGQKKKFFTIVLHIAFHYFCAQTL